MKIEIFSTADGKDLIANKGNEYCTINENDSIIDLIADIVDEKYPKASERLTKLYKTKFERVRRFCKCNFAINDQVPDIDERAFNFEFVNCPLRGECNDENIICNPVLETGLTLRETEIVREFASGKMAKEVAVALQITQRTAETHKRNIYVKIGIGTAVELAQWANHHGIC